jgi:hypothetical protein
MRLYGYNFDFLKLKNQVKIISGLFTFHWKLKLLHL